MTRRANPAWMPRAPYGRLQTATHPAAARLWRTRNEEPEEAPAFGWSSDYVVAPGAPNLEPAQEWAHFYWALVETLPRRLQKIVRLRFMCDATQTEIADMFGLTKERIRQLEVGALRRLRNRARYIGLYSNLSSAPPAKHPGFAWDVPDAWEAEQIERAKAKRQRMNEPVIPIDQIKREAHAAAERGASLNDACPWPFDSEAGRRFKQFFIMHKAALQALEKKPS